MIYYFYQSLFGTKDLLRVHGSAVYRVLLPVLLSTLILGGIAAGPTSDDIRADKIMNHPYAVGAFISFFSLLLTFRLNFSYARYMDSASACYQMTSKWLDCAMDLAAFHYQSEQYADIAPKSFGQYPDLRQDNLVGLDRSYKVSMDESVLQIEKADWESHEFSPKKKRNSWYKRSKNKDLRSPMAGGKSINNMSVTNGLSTETSRIPVPHRFLMQFAPNENVPNSPNEDAESVRRPSLQRQPRGTLKLHQQGKCPLPSMFLQETAHLVSLLSAVAFCTLRSDLEEAELPMTEYFPGMPWPAVDPDELSANVQQVYGEEKSVWRWMSFITGASRSSKSRTLYNAARPMTVLGGVSDQEVAMLHAARGPYAKMALCTMWLQEFIGRESMHGSTGKVETPILSRLFQFISDGVMGYNQARKVAYIPFPFVHAQCTSFFCAVIIFIFPMLFFSYVTKLWFAIVLNATTLACFLGIHETARELEQPFTNQPNDLPLATWQAQFNEALVCMYAGYHPDSWWRIRSRDAGTGSGDSPALTLRYVASVRASEYIFHPSFVATKLFLVFLTVVASAALSISTSATRALDAPANDLCIDAIPISITRRSDPIVLSGTTLDATDLERAPTCNDVTTHPGVWYKITLAFRMAVSISLCDLNNYCYDTQVSVYKGASGNF